MVSYKASFEVGLYPFLVTPKNLAEFLYAQENKEEIIPSLPEEAEILYRYIPGASPMVLYSPALITVDDDACHRLYLSANAGNVAKYHGLGWLIFELQRRNPIFSLVFMEKLYTEADKEQMQRMGLDIQEKIAHGWYRSVFEEEAYRGLLNKLKADLLLTMFLRGGAPLTK